ncbi:histidine phosphatase family protein [Rhodobacteraceae bacterium 2CG4]|uniref:Histidine phosphatase family protein n=1 Tax=Halovulum marinum TaxID=2662447 RepID=A0A6L5Z4W6_9RHOB|nr:histidine phosphatase family protein [Halovulum marinum]MSU91611.1 histidine phosphatase family protein [Halovulum marinum]
MKTLILMRHAKASRPEGVGDFDRPLSDRGAEAARAVGAWLRENGHLPQKALVSNAARTRETWEALGLEDDCPLRLAKELYDAASGQVLGTISRQEANVLLVIGHNPSIESLATYLLREETVPRELAKWKPGTCAVIEFDIADWKSVAATPGRLVDYATPRGLGVAAGAE